uniref:Uncharacterized protein n=1 Tax=Arundo donax TaxID=35708 RepID=A0A0A9E3C4_ARUDO
MPFLLVYCGYLFDCTRLQNNGSE